MSRNIMIVWDIVVFHVALATLRSEYKNGIEYQYDFQIFFKSEMSLLPVVYQWIRKLQKQDWFDKQLSKPHTLNLKSCTCNRLCCWQVLLSVIQQMAWVTSNLNCQDSMLLHRGSLEQSLLFYVNFEKFQSCGPHHFSLTTIIISQAYFTVSVSMCK